MPLPPQTGFGPPYQQVREHLIFRQGDSRPRALDQAQRRSHRSRRRQLARRDARTASRVAIRISRWVENPAPRRRSCCIACRAASSTTRSPIPTSSRSGAPFIRRSASPSICPAARRWRGRSIRAIRACSSASPRSFPRSRPKAAWPRSSIPTTAALIASTTSRRASSSSTSKRACRSIGIGFARRRRRSVSIGGCSRPSAIRSRTGIRRPLRPPACAA